ncbi:D-lactaldehyde dehydrogenase [Cantharellus anzutake]|uniref:D-lactaldehyde dehydrogenase n=1 Tax=Cantharellus anzutake TaxID=1750568 RepID=UPI001905CB76|nr:D-lactaldehyde dehydrogenase [Cantharellus anzutake]KAF8332666.1 D-lactaldehyde dehydrogenase [Cantharellus anzutake]
MSAVEAPAKILVTGASGFISAHVCRVALEHGYHVIGTVRSKSKGDYLDNLFREYGARFRYVVVEDIVKPSVFDDHVKGIDAVLHTASPFHFRANDPKELIDPAVHGTTGILKSIFKNGPNVKRVVITSSVAAVIFPTESPYTFTEKDWNTYSPDLIKKEGKNAPQGHKYQASKTLAEHAAWEFMKANEGNIKFDLVTINPSWVLGPTIHQAKEPKALNESIRQFWEHISRPQPKEALAVSGPNFVDVRDVALAHVRALEVSEAGGQRFIASKGPFTYQQFYDILRDARVPNVPEGYPGCDKNTKTNYQDGSKAERVLGLKYTHTKDTVIDTLMSIRTRFPHTNRQPVHSQL